MAAIAAKLNRDARAASLAVNGHCHEVRELLGALAYQPSALVRRLIHVRPWRNW